jgi:Ca-activated chloride channel homolog
MIFREPWILILLPAFLAAFLYMRLRGEAPGFLFPSDELIKTFHGGLKIWMVRRVIYLRATAIALVILALARPQVSREAEVKKEGIAIMLAIDCSSTMAVDDLQLTFEELAGKRIGDESRRMRRIDAVRQVAMEFVEARPDDIIGVVAFASEAFIVCPLTFDREWLSKALKRADVGLIKDGTAIGSGILSGLNSLKDTEAKSKVIVMLTDGINNFGKIPPLVAAKAARAMGIKIYTVGIVGKKSGLYAAEDGSGRRVYHGGDIDVDEEELEKIATLTGGQYFRVTDMKALKGSYDVIDRLEKANIEEKSYEEYVDVFGYFIFAALGLILLETFLRGTFLRRIP